MFSVTFDVPSWVHFIWFAIAMWQILWLMYGVLTLCRRDTHTGRAMYCVPGCIPITTYSMFACTLIANVTMQAALSHGYLDLAFVLSILVALTLFFCIYIASRRLIEEIPDMIEADREAEITLMRGILHNGLGLYAGWAYFYVFLLMGKLMAYYGQVEHTTAGIVCLSFWVAFYVAALFLDIAKWDRYTRHLVTPYFVAVFVAIGLLEHNVDWYNMTSLSYVIVIIFILMTFIAITRTSQLCLKNRKDRKRGKGINGIKMKPTLTQ
jgi:hypothetical protein